MFVIANPTRESHILAVCLLISGLSLVFLTLTSRNPYIRIKPFLFVLFSHQTHIRIFSLAPTSHPFFRHDQQNASLIHNNSEYRHEIVDAMIYTHTQAQTGNTSPVIVNIEKLPRIEESHGTHNSSPRTFSIETSPSTNRSDFG